MINKELEELLRIDDDDDGDIEDGKMDLDKIKENLPSYSSEKLCEMLVCDRYLGMGKNISIICMEELAKRRMAGDAFNFESHITEIQKELPVLDFTIPDIQEVLNQAIGRKFTQK